MRRHIGDNFEMQVGRLLGELDVQRKRNRGSLA